ncbi:MAG: class I poly(R)-hydroxyalkanoic acid synthase, partial [Gammaproteobacteria bacterium]
MGKTQEPNPQSLDPAQLAHLYADIAQKSGQLVTQYLKNGKNGATPAVADELGIAQAFFQAWTRLLADPLKLAEANLKLWQDYAALWQSSWLKLMGQETPPIAEPQPGDRRFKHEDWQNIFLYDTIKQSYL